MCVVGGGWFLKTTLAQYRISKVKEPRKAVLQLNYMLLGLSQGQAITGAILQPCYNFEFILATHPVFS